MTDRPNYPDGIPGHPYEERWSKNQFGAHCSFCGKPREHLTHELWHVKKDKVDENPPL